MARSTCRADRPRAAVVRLVGRVCCLLALLAVSCGSEGPDGGGGGSGGTGSAPETDARPAAGEAEGAKGAPANIEEAGKDPGRRVSSLGDVELATVRIGARGDFVNFEGENAVPEQEEGATGFLIDGGGTVVTNSHLAAGGEAFSVQLQSGRTLRARLIGDDECSDVAVLDVEGEGYPYLGWHGGEARPGLRVRAAGYPGDAYAETDGRVTQDAAEPWNQAAIGDPVVFDAGMEQGMSGGPLVNADAEVVGVLYSLLDEPPGRNAAVPAGEAREVVRRIREGEATASVGLDAGGVVLEGEDVSGLAVAGVTPGSPAEEAGLLPGDVVTELGGVSLAAYDTMKRYCGILRGHPPDEPLAVELLRPEDGELRTGELFGERLRAFGEYEPESYFLTTTDDAGALEVEVPASWHEVDGRTKEFAGSPAAVVVAAEDFVDAEEGPLEEPGLLFGASRKQARLYTEEEYLDGEAGVLSDRCERVGRRPFSRDGLSGAYDLWRGCEGGLEALTLAAAPRGRGYAVSARLVTPSGGSGEEIRERVLGSLIVEGSRVP